MKKSMNQKSQQGLSNGMDFRLMKRSSFVFQITSALAGGKKNLGGCFFAFLPTIRLFYIIIEVDQLLADYTVR